MKESLVFFAEIVRKKKKLMVKVNMAKRIFPIENKAALISMIFMGALLIMIGIWNEELSLMFKDMDITGYFLIYAALASFLLVVIELGIKRYSDLSKLKRFSNQQLVSFIVACLVVVSSIFSTFLPGLSWLTYFNGGTFVVQGLTVILEAFR